MRRPPPQKSAPVACRRRWPTAWNWGSSGVVSGALARLPRTITMNEPLQSGSVIDGYRLGECIHKGGTGAIFRATGPVEGEPGFPLVLKLPYLGPGESAIGIVSLEMEQIVLARLSGPHVPRFVDAGDIRSVPYVVMEWIDGAR